MKAMLHVFAVTAAILLAVPLQAQEAVTGCFSKDLDASIAACGRALDQTTDDATRRKVLLARGVRLAAKGRHEEAINDYDALLAFEPSNAMALNSRAASRLKLGRLADAKADAAKSLAASQTNPLTYTLLGIIALNEGDLEGTIGYSTKAIDMDSRQSAAFGNRAAALREQGKYPEAIKDFNASLRIDAYSPRVLYQRGLTYFRLKDYDRALSDYRASLAINPEDSEVAKGVEVAERLRAASSSAPVAAAPSPEPTPRQAPPPSPPSTQTDPEMVVLCAGYNEEYVQRTRLDILSGRSPSNATASARFKRQTSLCPAWQKQQQIEAKKRFVNDLTTRLVGNPECRRYAASIQEISRTLVGYPQLDEGLESAMLQLGLGQRAEYCRTVSALVNPYMKLREIAGSCDLQLWTSLGLVFGSVRDEALQNGCR